MRGAQTGPGRRFPVGLTLSVAVALVILLGLGTWQVERLAWKQDLLARIAALEAAPAQPAGPVLERLSRGEDVGFTRIRVTCPGLGSAPYLQLYSLRDGQAGTRLVSACPSPSRAYGVLLVDRGFVADTISSRPPVAGDSTPVEIVGVLRAPDPANAFSPANRADRWFTRDPAAMALALKAVRPAPMFLMAETSSNPEWKALAPAVAPAEISNNHLGYAITWYGLAAALLGVYAAMLFRWRKN